MAKTDVISDVSENPLRTPNGKSHEEMRFCWRPATKPLNQASNMKPTKSNASAIVADDCLPPRLSAYIDGGM